MVFVLKLLFGDKTCVLEKFDSLETKWTLNKTKMDHQGENLLEE